MKKFFLASFVILILPTAYAMDTRPPEIAITIELDSPAQQDLIEIAAQTCPKEITDLVKHLKKEYYSCDNRAPAILFYGDNDDTQLIPIAVAELLEIQHFTITSFASLKRIPYPRKKHALVVSNLNALYEEYKKRHLEEADPKQLIKLFIGFIKSLRTEQTILLCGMTNNLENINKEILGSLFTCFGKEYQAQISVPRITDKEYWMLLQFHLKKFPRIAYRCSQFDTLYDLAAKRTIISKLKDSQIPVNHLGPVISALQPKKILANEYRLYDLFEQNYLQNCLANAKIQIDNVFITKTTQVAQESASQKKCCPICNEEKVNYFKTPCCSTLEEEKIICETCIKHWLIVQKKETCPNCRCKLTLHQKTEYELIKQ